MRNVALMGLAAVVLVGSALAGPALAQTQTRMPAENWAVPYRAAPSAIPACEAPEVLAHIQTRFAQNEAEYWSSNLTILGFEKVRPVAFRPWGLDFIPRQFCTGVATTSDGRKRQVDYSVVEDAGMAGYGWGVTWCVVGVDRQIAYGAACKAARP